MAITSLTVTGAATNIDTATNTYQVGGTAIVSNANNNLSGTINLTITASTGDVIQLGTFAVGPLLRNGTRDWTVNITDPADIAALEALPVGTTFTVSGTFTTSGGNTPTVNSLTGESITCFMAGTMIRTPAGEVAIESLKAGDLVLTADGTPRAVRWVGRQTVSLRFAEPSRALPVRVAAGALGGGLPQRDLLVSPGHALLVDGILANAGALVNGTTIRQESDVPTTFTYYHVELDAHALLLAEGAPAESFVDNVEPGRFDNVEERAAGAAPVAELDLPRASAARQVPAATRARLAAIAAELAGAARQAA